MRANEFITEQKKGKIKKRQQQPTRGLNLFRDSEKANSDYTLYRLSMATAMSDGVTPINIDGESWIGKRRSAHPYTQQEQDMLMLAYKAVGASYSDLNKGDMRSQELTSTNVLSPTPNRNNLRK